MTNKTRLIKWIGSMGKKPEEAVGIADNLIKKLLPYKKLMPNQDIDEFLGKCLRDTACTSLFKFKEIANYRISKLK